VLLRTDFFFFGWAGWFIGTQGEYRPWSTVRTVDILIDTIAATTE